MSFNASVDSGDVLLEIPIPAMGSTLGALLICGYCAAALYGLISHQAYRYYRMYPQDVPELKQMVAIFWIVETFHVALIIHICYTYMITDYFNPLALEDGIWSLRISIAVASITIFMAQSFLAKRLYILGGKKLILYVLMVTMAALGSMLAICVTAASFVAVSFKQFEKYEWIMAIALGMALLTNLITTVHLCWILSGSRTGFSKTDTLIDTLMVYTVNTGLITSLVTLADLICVLTMRDNFIFIGLFFIINKLYTNSILAILNSRRGMAHRNEQGSFDLRTTFEPPRPQAAIPLHHRTPYQFNGESSQEAINDAPYERVFDIRKPHNTSSASGDASS